MTVKCDAQLCFVSLLYCKSNHCWHMHNILGMHIINSNSTLGDTILGADKSTYCECMISKLGGNCDLALLIPGAYERCEGASNYHTLFVPSSVESHALNLAENAPYKVSSMFTPTLLRSQQVAIITAGRLLGSILVTVVISKLVNTSNL